MSESRHTITHTLSLTRRHISSEFSRGQGSAAASPVDNIASTAYSQRTDVFSPNKLTKLYAVGKLRELLDERHFVCENFTVSLCSDSAMVQALLVLSHYCRSEIQKPRYTYQILIVVFYYRCIYILSYV